MPLPEIPALPADAQPDKYNGFKRRILAIDHTGTGCGYCPFVIGALREIEQSDYADKVVFVAGHSYNSSDPMYTIEAPVPRTGDGCDRLPLGVV